MKLNLGCGRDIRDGWVNIDSRPGKGVDLVTDFDDNPVLPFEDSSVDESEGSHLIEHLRNPLPFMEELWRVTKPGGLATFRCPFGSSDDADEDPTHVRRMFCGSWGYFAQPHYHRADYGYRGDWQATEIELTIFGDMANIPTDDLVASIRFRRNVVSEMCAKLECVKPAREPLLELQQSPHVTLVIPE